jgi:threonine 3-dehydrogenase
MRILVTGAGGQVGTDLLPMLAARGHEPAGFDLADAPPALRGLPWWKGDVSVREEVFDVVRAARADAVWHLAAVLSATGEKAPFRAWRVNLDGTRHVLEAARTFGVPQVLFTSTIAAFGPGLEEPVGNDVSMRPTTVYGVTKVAGELLGEYYRARWGLDFRGVRFPGLVSAVEPGGGTSDYVNYMYFDALRKGSYDAFCRADTTIPLMYMPDALRALAELSEASRERLTRCMYNIAAMSPRADEIAAAVMRRVKGSRIGFAPVAHRQAILDSWPKALDDSLARRDWGWAPRFDLEAMSDELIEAVRATLPGAAAASSGASPAGRPKGAKPAAAPRGAAPAARPAAGKAPAKTAAPAARPAAAGKKRG